MTAPSFRGLMAASQLPRIEALALMQAASGRSREWLIAHEPDDVDAATQALFDRYAKRRRNGEPVAYITGWREFYGRSFWVNSHTLIPRIDTELLVDTALECLTPMALPADTPIRLCDLGTGSGCIAISMALGIKRPIQIAATDMSAQALRVARNNAAWLGASKHIDFYHGSWWDATAPQDAMTQLSIQGVSGQRFHGIISNPPYIREHDPHLSTGDLRYEPASALCSADAGLADITTIAMGALERLEPGGFLLIEHGFDQQDDVCGIFARAGLAGIAGLRDLAGHPRAVLGFSQPGT